MAMLASQCRSVKTVIACIINAVHLPRIAETIIAKGLKPATIVILIACHNANTMMGLAVPVLINVRADIAYTMFAVRRHPIAVINIVIQI
jgi:ribosomal protein L11